MSFHYGDYATGATVYMDFGSFAASTGAPSATTNFAAADIQIYKNGSATQRSSSAGITVTTTFDSLTGLQMVAIDLSDNTDAGFYAAGGEYNVAVSDITVDSQTLRFWLGAFSIQRTGGALAKILSVISGAGVNTTQIGGTTQTARDLGASVLLSSGTGTGQVSLSSGKISGVVLADTLTTYTGNTVQTGDSFARIGAAGAGLTALGDTRIANLDATVSSRMATYTQPTGFLAATFPSGTIANTTNITAGTIAVATSVTNRVTANTDQFAGQTITAAAGVTLPASVASPTNITAGTITTATNLTNAPTAGDFTATMKTSLNSSTPASVTTVTGNVVGSVGSVTAAVTVDGTSPLTEVYPAAGKSLTLASALYDLTQQMGEVSITGITRTVNKRDGATAAMTFTLNSATAPTSSTQAT